MFWDADEYFSKDTAGNLRSVIEKQTEDVNLILAKRDDVDEEGRVMLSLYVPRIFRIKRSLRYIGAIHEELRQNGETVTGVRAASPAELNLVHTGYAGELGVLKVRRNLKILLKEFKTAENPERLYGYMAETYDGLGDRQNAMKFAYLDVQRGRQPTVYASRSYRLLMAKLAENPKDNGERKRVLEAALKEYPELPEFYAEYAEALAAEKDYSAAIKQMQRAIGLGENYKGMEPTVFNGNMKIIWQNRLLLWESKAKVQ